MAQRTRRKSAPIARKAPAWVPDDLLDRIGTLIGDHGFVRDARKTPLVWSHGIERLVDHAGGPVPGNELHEPIDDLVGRYGLPRVALTLLRSGAPMTLAKPVAMRFVAENGLEPVPVVEGDDAEASGDDEGVREELDRVVRDRDRLSQELQRTREKLLEKDRKLREERVAHQATRSELTSGRDKALHQVSELRDQIEAGPSGAVLSELGAHRDRAERRADEALAAQRAAEGATATALAEAAAVREQLAAAEAAATEARDEAARVAASAAARRAAPTAEDLLLAAQTLGADALKRIAAPEPGDAELLAAVSAVAVWSARRANEPAGEGAPAAVPSPPTPPIRTSELVEGVPAIKPAPIAPVPIVPDAVLPRVEVRPRAARITVVGGGGIGASAYLVEHGGRRVLLDCGIGSSGRGAAIPPGIDAVVLSHAHGDHMGAIPDLLRSQPNVRVYCSKATKLLAMYQANAAETYIPGDRILVRDPGETYRILDGAIELTLHRVAHCLGSCAVRLRYVDGLSVVYSGDLGGIGLRTLRPDDPLPVSGAHAVLLESTLGDRRPSRADYEGALLREVEGVVSGGGCAVFPATNIGRAQELAALIAEGFATGALPEAPVYMTPLARRVLERYRAGDRDGWLAPVRYPDVRPLGPDFDADELVSEPGYVIVGGASGLERRSGRLAYAAAQRRECGVFFTGYSGMNAKGRTRGDTLEVVAEDGQISSTTISCRWQWTPSPDHAAQEELVRAVHAVDRDVPILLVHGGDEPKRALSDRLRQAGHRDVRALQDGDVVTVASPAADAQSA
jgi:metallo-beta-lactamase family protein